MKRLVSIAALVAAMFAATVQAQDNSDRFPVTLSDPSKPALVKVNFMNGSISVRTHTGKDIVVEGRAVAARGRNQETRDGLRRIDTNQRGLTIEEANNVVTVSRQSFNNGGNIEIQVVDRNDLFVALGESTRTDSQTFAHHSSRRRTVSHRRRVVRRSCIPSDHIHAQSTCVIVLHVDTARARFVTGMTVR